MTADGSSRPGAVLAQAAEHGFIRAKVIAYDESVRFKGEQGGKEAGKMWLEGKVYFVKDSDAIYFRFNV